MADKQLRVVHVCRRLTGSSGGTTTSVRQFQSALGGQVIAFQDTGDHDADPDLISVRCDAGRLGRAYGWASGDAIATASDVLKGADLVVCHMLLQYHSQWAAKYARQFGIPYWLVPHGSLDPYVFSYRAVRKRWWMRLVGQRVIREAARVLFATERERAKAESLVGPLRNTSTLPWPVQHVDLQDKAERRAAIRSRFAIPDSERVLLYVGRLQRMKRLMETIQAVGRVSDRRTSLIVVGPDGDLTRKDCQDLCRVRGWSNIHFAGPIYGHEILDFYKAADGFISLSMKENFGHAVAEALAAELPIILSPGVDLAPELAEVGCGWMLASATEEAVAKSIHDFSAASGDSLGEIGARGRRWVDTRLSPSVFEAKIRQLACADVDPGSRHSEDPGELSPV